MICETLKWAKYLLRGYNTGEDRKSYEEHDSESCQGKNSSLELSKDYFL